MASIRCCSRRWRWALARLVARFGAADVDERITSDHPAAPPGRGTRATVDVDQRVERDDADGLRRRRCDHRRRQRILDRRGGRRVQYASRLEAQVVVVQLILIPSDRQRPVTAVGVLVSDAATEIGFSPSLMSPALQGYKCFGIRPSQANLS